MRLDIERESEKKSEYSVGFAGKQGEDGAEHPLVDDIEPRRIVGIYGEDEVFEVVHEKYGKHCESPEGVD